MSGHRHLGEGVRRGGGMHGQGIFDVFRQNQCYFAIFCHIEQHGSAEVPV